MFCVWTGNSSIGRLAQPSDSDSLVIAAWERNMNKACFTVAIFLGPVVSAAFLLA
jgi:hypothetical protein